MENGLKAGQRIGIVNVVRNQWGVKGIVEGNSYAVAITHPEGSATIYTPGRGPSDYAYMYESEIVQVGCFIVREVKTNTDPCTII